MTRAAGRAAEGDGVWTSKNQDLQGKLAGIRVDTKLRAYEKNAPLPEEQTPAVKIAKETADAKRQLRDMENTFRGSAFQKCLRRFHLSMLLARVCTWRTMC